MFTEGIEAYIRQFVKNPKYSEILYASSNAAGNILRELNSLGAKVIVLHTIDLSMVTLAGSVVTITDRKGKIVKQFLQDASMNGAGYLFPYVIKTSELFFVSDVPAVRFTVSYQYIQETDTPAHKQ